MRIPDASFSVRLLRSSRSDRDDLDRALDIFVRNTSALLRTKTNQIRDKVRNPNMEFGKFYFAALYRGELVIGFAMFGHYYRTKLIVVDHMVIEGDQRSGAAFYAFSQLLSDVIYNLKLEVDFIAVEIEKDSEFGGLQTSGPRLARLLGQIGFGEVHVSYVIPNIEQKNYDARYHGVLMIKGNEKLYKIRKEDFLEIYKSILFEHYFDWYKDFFGRNAEMYHIYLENLYSESEKSLKDSPIVRINGAEEGGLADKPLAIREQTPEIKAAWYIILFVLTVIVVTTSLYVLKPPAYLMVPILFGILTIFAGIISIGNGKAFDVFKFVLFRKSSDRHRSHYRQLLQRLGSLKEHDRQEQILRKD